MTTHGLVWDKMATHSSTLASKIPWMEEPGVLQPMGSQWVGHDWATSLSLLRRRESVLSQLCRLGFRRSSYRHSLSPNSWRQQPWLVGLSLHSLVMRSQLCLIRVYSNSGWPHCFLYWDVLGLCHCVSLRYTVYWFDKSIYFIMITTVA